MKHSPLVKAALAVAKKYPVFPTNEKRPCWSNAELGVKRGEGGYKVATQDPARVIELFSHPRATEIAVPMGELSGLICIDVDSYKTQDGELRRWALYNLPSTVVHGTRSGGYHYIYKHPGDVGRLPATLREGVDLKSNGNGYICWPPTEGYEVEISGRVAPFPMHVVEQALIEKGGSGKIGLSDGSFNAMTDGELIDLILSGEDFYGALRTLSWRMAGRGMSADDVTSTLNNIMQKSVAEDLNHQRHDDWAERYLKIGDLALSAVEKNKSPEFTEEEAALVMDGKPFMENQPARPIGPQRETTISDIEKRVADLPVNPLSEFLHIDIGKLRKKRLKPIEWLIPQILPAGGIVSLGGSSNVGKTRWLAALVTALSAGRLETLGLPGDASAATLWVANEERAEDIERRVKAVVLQNDFKQGRPIVVRGKDTGMLRLVALNETGQPEIDEEAVAHLVAEIKALGVQLVIFDPYITLADGADENNAASAALLTKVFIIISMMTGACVLHAHHTPKDRAKDVDWYRGDAGAWRGSGAIYSGLDVGLTLAPWMPQGPKRKIWKQQALALNLSRWIVLDTGKLREGRPIPPVVYEMVGQEMDEGEGDEIGVCRLADAAQAENSLLDGAIDTIHATELAHLLYNTLGTGVHRSPHKQLRGHALWPAVGARMQDRDHQKLLEMFGDKPVRAGDFEVVYRMAGTGKSTQYTWEIYDPNPAQTL